MPSFADSIFLFVLALLLFGPKKLPVLARELGKWVGEFRRASNEFKMQMEDELRASEQADRQKQIAAMEAAAPIPPPLDEPAEEEHPHLRSSSVAPPPPLRESLAGDVEPASLGDISEIRENAADSAVNGSEEISEGVRPLPIATSGELRMMPPATGLPTPRGRGGNPLGGGLLDAIPEAADPRHEAGEVHATNQIHEASQETTAHGD